MPGCKSPHRHRNKATAVILFIVTAIKYFNTFHSHGYLRIQCEINNFFTIATIFCNLHIKACGPRRTFNECIRFSLHSLYTGLMCTEIVLLHYTDWVMFVNSDDSLYYLSLLARLITGGYSHWRLDIQTQCIYIILCPAVRVLAFITLKALMQNGLLFTFIFIPSKCTDYINSRN